MNRTVRTTILSAAAWAALSGVAGCGEAESEPPAREPVPTHTPPPVTVTHEARQVGKPTEVAIPAIGVSERLHGVGLKANGAMETPDFGKAGWYDLGPRPGAPGPAV